MTLKHTIQSKLLILLQVSHSFNKQKCNLLGLHNFVRVEITVSSITTDTSALYLNVIAMRNYSSFHCLNLQQH